MIEAGVVLLIYWRQGWQGKVKVAEILRHRITAENDQGQVLEMQMCEYNKTM